MCVHWAGAHQVVLSGPSRVSVAQQQLPIGGSTTDPRRYERADHRVQLSRPHRGEGGVDGGGDPGVRSWKFRGHRQTEGRVGLTEVAMGTNGVRSACGCHRAPKPDWLSQSGGAEADPK